MRFEDGYHQLKGFSTDTAKSLELRGIELLDIFVEQKGEVSFDPVLNPFRNSCKRSNMRFV
jgi:hypothetical protein